MTTTLRDFHTELAISWRRDSESGSTWVVGMVADRHGGDRWSSGSRVEVEIEELLHLGRIAGNETGSSAPIPAACCLSSIAGEERSIKVAVEQSGETARIASWLDDTLSIAPLRSPGGFQVNGSLAVGELEESRTFVALPGVYEFIYVDPAGLGTVNPDGTPTTAFEVEFPIEGPQLTSVVPPGVEALGSGISAEPILLAEVDDAVESQLADVVAECSASALIGDACPRDLVSRVSSQGAVDVSTIVWKRDETKPPSTSADWDVVAGYSIAYRLESGSASTADATYSGVVTAPAPGKPVLELTR